MKTSLIAKAEFSDGEGLDGEGDAPGLTLSTLMFMALD